MLPRNVTCILILSLAHDVFAQRVEQLHVSQGLEQSSERVKTYLTYDLMAAYDNIPCQVKVKFLTADDKFYYLKQLTGDVGDLVYPGKGKKIVWDHVEELVHFSGDVSLMLEVTPSVKVPGKIKRSRQMTIALAPIYTPNKSYAVKLYRDKQEVSRLNDVLLIENSFQVTIPKKTKPKKNYQLAITDGEKTFYSNPFKIKPKMSRTWFLLPVLAVPAYYVVDQYLDSREPLPGPPVDN